MYKLVRARARTCKRARARTFTRVKGKACLNNFHFVIILGTSTIINASRRITRDSCAVSRVTLRILCAIKARNDNPRRHSRQKLAHYRARARKSHASADKNGKTTAALAGVVITYTRSAHYYAASGVPSSRHLLIIITLSRGERGA